MLVMFADVKFDFCDSSGMRSKNGTAVLFGEGLSDLEIVGYIHMFLSGKHRLTGLPDLFGHDPHIVDTLDDAKKHACNLLHSGKPSHK